MLNFRKIHGAIDHLELRVQAICSFYYKTHPLSNPCTHTHRFYVYKQMNPIPPNPILRFVHIPHIISYFNFNIFIGEKITTKLKAFK